MTKTWLEERKTEIERLFNEAGDEITRLEAKRSEYRGAFSMVNEMLDKLNEVEIIPPKRVKGAKK